MRIDPNQGQRQGKGAISGCVIDAISLRNSETLEASDLDQSLKLSQWIFDLTKPFIGRDGHAGGEIQTACALPNHGDRHSLRRMLKKEVRIKPLGFLSKYEPVSGSVLRLKISSLSFRGKEPHATGILDQFDPVFKSFVAVPGQVGPVIQPRSFKVGVVDLKPHFSHNVQLAVGAHAGAPDVSGILRNFGLDQNNAEKFLGVRQGA